MSRNTSATGNTTPRIAPERVLLVNIIRYLLADLQGEDQLLKQRALEWLYDEEDYDYNFYNVMSMLANRTITDRELLRIRVRMISQTLIPKWARASYGDKSNKMPSRVEKVHRINPVFYSSKFKKK